jgi:electron transfer flavoprotein alpha subunit
MIMAQGVLVFIEARQGAIKKSSLEALSAGRRLADEIGQEVTALVIGADPSSPELATYGADRVLAARHDLLASYSPEGYAAALAQAARKSAASVVLGSATAMGRDFLPRAAAALRAGLAQDCVEAKIVDGKLECVRPIYAGKAFARVRPETTPAMATLRPNVFGLVASAAPKAAVVEEFAPAISPDKVRARVTGVVAAGGQKIELTEANIIVSGGRGLKGPENFPIVQALADAFGGALGASRAAVDAGWIDHSHQVGQTGKTVSPTLYVACGISGAIQHLAGMSSSKCIVAINKDPEAPIFKVANYGIVGDLFTVVPALTEEIRKLKSS